MAVIAQDIPLTTEIRLQAKAMNDGAVQIRVSVGDQALDEWTPWTPLQTGMRFTVTQNISVKEA